MRRRSFMSIPAAGAAGSMLGSIPAIAQTGDTITEPAKTIEVVDEADIIVLGSGPAGTAAAIAAGRLGADVLLVERYGTLGGMATGGLIIMIGEFNRNQTGLPTEFVDRIMASGGRMVETDRIIKDEPFLNPDIFQHVLLTMCAEANVRLRLHSWAVGAQVTGNRIDALIVESKSGRQAIRAKMVIDCSGDADTAAWTGVPFENTASSIGLGLDFMYGHVDFAKYRHFMTYEPEAHKAIMNRAGEQDFGWRPWFIGWEDKAWFNTSFAGDPANVDDLTACEIDIRNRIMQHYLYYRENMPGFEVATIDRIAWQTGCRSSRRIQGEHVLTMAGLTAGSFEDTIGKVSGLEREKLSDVPYRCLVPKAIDNVLYAGRCISADLDVINKIRGITGCWVFGQAAGTAGHMAVQAGRAPRDLAVASIQRSLRSQGVGI